MWYKDDALLKDIGCRFLVMWIDDSGKKFKINIDGSIRMEVRTSRQSNIGELSSQVKKFYGLGKDAIFTDINQNIFDRSESAYSHRKEMWLSRYRFEKTPKLGEIREVKILIE
jgi:hypothetical protein